MEYRRSTTHPDIVCETIPLNHLVASSKGTVGDFVVRHDRAGIHEMRKREEGLREFIQKKFRESGMRCHITTIRSNQYFQLASGCWPQWKLRVTVK